MLHRLGGLYARLGEQEEASEIYRQLDELLEELEDVKLEFDVWVHTEWASNPIEFVEERYERALRIAEEMGDTERQKYCLAIIADFDLRRVRYTRASRAGQRRCQIAKELEDHEEWVLAEAVLDLAQALIADPEGECAIKGGMRRSYRVAISDKEITCSGGGGILPMACDRRPHPAICHPRSWLDAPLLRLPVTVGERWSHSDRGGAVERVIEADDEAVDVLAGRLDHCVRVKSTVKLRATNEGSPQADEVYNRRRGFGEGEKWMWFAPGVGIVKAEHHHPNGKRTTIELTSYHLAEPSDACFPLAIGNVWCYEWRDEHGDLLFKEQDRVICEVDGEFRLACSGYTTNVAEYGDSDS